MDDFLDVAWSLLGLSLLAHLASLCLKIHYITFKFPPISHPLSLHLWKWLCTQAKC